MRKKNKNQTMYRNVEVLPDDAVLATDFANKLFIDYTNPHSTLYQYYKRRSKMLEDYEIVFNNRRNYVIKK